MNMYEFDIGSQVKESTFITSGGLKNHLDEALILHLNDL